MDFKIEANSGVPIYRQMVEQLRDSILAGRLAAGEQLPSVRELSAQVKINPLTVSKVYQTLESEELLETRRGIGTYVNEKAKEITRDKRRERIAKTVSQLVSEALVFELSEQEVIEMVKEKFKTR
ncbi:MAG: GntR family transcriptional regulator [Verrucomicrobiota bacterium]